MISGRITIDDGPLEATVESSHLQQSDVLRHNPTSLRDLLPSTFVDALRDFCKVGVEDPRVAGVLPGPTAATPHAFRLIKNWALSFGEGVFTSGHRILFPEALTLSHSSKTPALGKVTSCPADAPPMQRRIKAIGKGAPGCVPARLQQRDETLEGQKFLLAGVPQNCSLLPILCDEGVDR